MFPSCLPSAAGMDASLHGFLRNQNSPFLVVFGIMNLKRKRKRWDIVEWSTYQLRAPPIIKIILKVDFAVCLCYEARLWGLSLVSLEVRRI